MLVEVFYAFIEVLQGEVQIWLRLRDGLSPVLFNLAPEMVVRKLRENGEYTSE